MNQHTSKASLFLMELIIAILVFSLASALCVQFFAKAHLLTNRTQALNHAVSLSESAAEIFYGTKGELSAMQKILDSDGTGSLNASSLTLYYDDDFSSCTIEQAVYRMTIATANQNTLQNADISVINLNSNDTPIYSLKVKRYMGGASL